MATQRKPRHKTSRRFGVDIYGTGGESLERRLNVPPGGFRKSRRRTSEYGLQLQEKQKLRAIYGISEKQLRRYYDDAQRDTGNPGENLLKLLERRLDNVIYRLGFARTRPMARQLVNQGHVRINGRRVDIASYLVRGGETLALSQTAAEIPAVVEDLERQLPTPSWLKREEGGKGQVIMLPSADEAGLPVDLRQVIAFYSR